MTLIRGILYISAGIAMFGAVSVRAADGPIPPPKEKVPVTSGKPSKFTTPVWDIEARWERETVVWYQNCGDPLDGPRVGMQANGDIGSGAYFEGGGDAYLRKFDPKLDRYFTLSASAPGYLDGPLSRARFGTTGYGRERATAWSPNGRLLYFTEPDMKGILRCIDFEKSTVSTVLKEVGGSPGMTVDSKGMVYIVSYGGFQIVTPDGKVEKRAIEFAKGTQGYALSLVIDEKNNRLYAARRDTHVWYWDLNANGKYVEVLNSGNSKSPARELCATGPFDGLHLHCPKVLVKGPNDPDVKFLYFGGGDDRSFYRLDLEKKCMLRFRPVEGDKSGLFYFGEAPGKVGTAIWGWCEAPEEWSEGGDFYLRDWSGGSAGLYRFKRVK